MSTVIGFVLYVLCIAWLCALTGINRLDDPEPPARSAREDARSKATAPAGRVPAPEAQG